MTFRDGSYSLTGVILCGGSGTRLWPLSRLEQPKQFIPLAGSLCPFSESVMRFSDSGSFFTDPIIVTGSVHRFMARRYLDELGISGDIFCESEGRGSGPALLAGAFLAIERYGKDAYILGAPSDHVVGDVGVWHDAFEASFGVVSSGRIVTFGVAPRHPSSDYGYIKPLIADGDGDIMAIESFHEKPELSVSESYISSGYLWNSGHFLSRADVLIEEYRKFFPSTVSTVQCCLRRSKRVDHFIFPDSALWRGAHNDSFDFAVMERTDLGSVYRVESAWSDLGNWNALWSHVSHDESGNGVDGSGESLFVSARDNYVHTDENILTVVAGVDDIAVASMGDVVMVTDRRRTDLMRKVVSSLRERGDDRADRYGRVFRPWGWYERLCLGRGFQVKRICVYEGCRLSLQSHNYRSEHWVRVGGSPVAVVGDRRIEMGADCPVFIPLGARHRLENAGTGNAEIIEVQLGAYLEEDDIIRYEDDFHRV